MKIDIIEYAYTQNIFTVYKCKKARFELLQLQGGKRKEKSKQSVNAIRFLNKCVALFD